MVNIKEKIEKIKHKAAMHAVKVATIATVATGAAATLTSCKENNQSAENDGEKIENIKGAKTSVVFRVDHVDAQYHHHDDVLFENGDNVRFESNDKADYLQPGDTVTYRKKRIGSDVIDAVRYKNGNEKVNFGKIGKIEKDITD